jgi:hypothetical protein
MPPAAAPVGVRLLDALLLDDIFVCAVIAALLLFVDTQRVCARSLCLTIESFETCCVLVCAAARAPRSLWFVRAYTISKIFVTFF